MPERARMRTMSPAVGWSARRGGREAAFTSLESGSQVAPLPTGQQ